MALRTVDWLVEYLELPSRQVGYRLMREGLVPSNCVVHLGPRRVRVIEEAIRLHFEGRGAAAEGEVERVETLEA